MSNQPLEPLTLVMAVYGQPQMLAKQISVIACYDKDVIENLQVIIVDDHGDPAVSANVGVYLQAMNVRTRIYRIDTDINWNQMGARNLGMHHADGWCLMIDPDMLFDCDMMRRMMQAAAKLQRGRLVKYGLTHLHNDELDMSSPNTYMIHKQDFFDVGGYDEDFAGNKGWSDVQLLDVLKSTYKIDLRPDLWAHFYSTDEIPDAMVTKLDRSTSANKLKRIKKTDQARAAGGWARWAKSRIDSPRLRFEWTQVFPTS